MSHWRNVWFSSLGLACGFAQGALVTSNPAPLVAAIACLAFCQAIHRRAFS